MITASLFRPVKKRWQQRVTIMMTTRTDVDINDGRKPEYEPQNEGQYVGVVISGQHSILVWKRRLEQSQLIMMI